MNPLPRHRDEGVVIETWLDVIVKTCGGFTDTRREMVVVELQEELANWVKIFRRSANTDYSSRAGPADP